MNADLIKRLQKILALTTSPIEGEAQAALAKLHQLLAQHNLDMADLEQRGETAPSVGGKDHDLGNAAFKWKLELAEVLAKHFFCFAIIDNRTKKVTFVGRPDNVDSMKALYDWMIDQIKRICSARRKDYLVENPHDHIDPLRWQVQFGLGIVSRMGDRLEELKKKQQDEAGSALIIHHETEISDYLEQQYGYRVDGKRTKRVQAYYAARAVEEAELQALKESDLEAYYARCPWERPETEAERAKREKQEIRDRAKREARWEREAAREANKYISPQEMKKRRQERTARISGAESAQDVNLEPFLTTTVAPSDADKIK